MKEKILVLDFGGQYTQLIAKAVRKCNVFSEIIDCNTSIDDIIGENPSGVILSGGPESVYNANAPGIDESLLHSNIPVLGICYGMQLINYISGGKILNGNVIKEYGKTKVDITNHPLFSGLEKRIDAWMSHGDSVDGNNLAPGFEVIARTQNHVAAIADDAAGIYGVQFHPEVTHTEKGIDIISNFVHKICLCDDSWTMGNYIEESKDYIRKTIGKNDVISFVSGGVDSTFVTALLAQTEGIGEVYAIYIDALMRKHETDQVEKSLKDAGVKNLIVCRAEDRFIDAVKGMSDPEQKRKAIGNLFGVLQQEMADKLGLDAEKTFLAQGTLYTDLIESGKGVGKKAAMIKSHHNVGCKFIEDQKAKGLIVEPNRLIFKDEVREAAKQLGLPPEIYQRQPFPGPGLGIRIVDGVAKYENDFKTLSWAVDMVANQYDMRGYALPIKTVGVQGDSRTYTYLGLLKGERNWKNIRDAAVAIPTELNKINRIVYAIGDKDIHYNDMNVIPTTVTRKTIDMLKDIDHEGNRIIDKYGFNRDISQTIFILFGADIYGNGKRGVALRGVSTDDFMTVAPIEPFNIKKGELYNYRKNNKIRMSWECLDEIRDVLLAKYDIGAFVIDVTDKPPATTCWE